MIREKMGKIRNSFTVEFVSDIDLIRVDGVCISVSETDREGVARIGGAGGFWGDRPLAAVEMLRTTEMDYLTMDYLAELTMSILAKQRSRDPEAGWATDLSDWLSEDGMGLLHAKGVKLVTNAGGANPRACAAAVLDLAHDEGWHECKVAIVEGDDMLGRLDEFLQQGETLHHLESGESISHVRDDITAVNAYLGAGAAARGLARGADIVICGRIADASLIVACMLHSAGWAQRAEELDLPLHSPIETWAPDDVENPLDVVAGWTLAGHLIECGAQVTGGNSSDWASIEDLVDVGYPVAESHIDGSCVITKPEGSGGRVDRRVVVEQLLYEIGDPARYLTPDCVLDITAVTLADAGENRVLVQGARGSARPSRLKVSAAHRDGWFATANLLVPGPDAAARAEVADRTLRQRLARSGCDGLRIETEAFGSGVTLPPGMPHADFDPPELLVRWAAMSAERSEVVSFSREIAPLVLTGPAGISGYGARPKPREQFRFWPTLIDRGLVEGNIRLELLEWEQSSDPEAPLAPLASLRLRVGQRKARLEADIRGRLEHVVETVPEGRIRHRVASSMLDQFGKEDD